jgi:hypothetical protein
LAKFSENESQCVAYSARAILLCAAVLGLPTVPARAAEAPPQEPFLQANSTVVLLTGLAGDVESEERFHGELQTLLELVAANHKEGKFVVLCDNPESSASGTGPEVTFLRADRTNFLNLTSTLAGEANPLVVIAWGHGGKQGNAPVFHVRGPRLTPADFQTLASRIQAGQSHWILLYRGSGAFARRMAAPGRSILTSDCDSIFENDPVGMAALLKILRADPKVSFEDLAGQFGKATAAWYATRQLARTEEPTLWRGTDKPRLLSPAVSEENSFASITNEATGQVKPSSHTQTNSAELPASWRSIERTEAQKFPEADGVVLRRRLSYTLGQSPAVTSDEDEFLQVLTPEGKRFGDFDISYAPPFEDITFLDCEVQHPDGTLSRLDADAIRDTGETSAGDYQLGHRKFFSLPGISPGAILHVHFRREWKTFPFPHVSLEIPVGIDLPAIDSAVQVGVPKDVPFHFLLEQLGSQDPAIRQGSYGTTYSWTFTNLPAASHEALAPPGPAPRVLISTFPDWPDFAQWYARIAKLTDEVTPEIASKAAELTRDAKTSRAKLLAVYNYVAALRYVAVPLGVNSFRPHSAANVLRNQFGDCKDKANLFDALLHALNIQANLVLVPRFADARPELPGLSFNHAISRVVLDGETIWVDTTDDICRFGILPPGDPGRNVLVIDAQTNALTQLPAPLPRDHRLTVRAEVNCANLSEALPLALNAKASGFPDYALRAAARQTQGKGATLPVLTTQLRPFAGVLVLDHQTATPVSALDEDFSWKAEGSWLGGASTNGSGGVLHCPFWLPADWELALHHRASPLFLSQGYPLLLEEEFEFSLPAGLEMRTMPTAMENKEPPLQWRIEWKKTENQKATAKFRAELERGDLSLSETIAFQAQLRSLFQALSVEAPLARPP